MPVYQGFADYARTGAVAAAPLDAALASLDGAFYDPAGVLRAGVYDVYSTSSGDLTNTPLYDLAVTRANPKVLADAEPGDLRVAAKLRRDPSLRQTNNDSTVVSDVVFTNITGPTSALPVLTNVELVLLRAEALWGLGRDAETLALVKVVRQRDGGLGARPAASFATCGARLHEILRQKRFALLFERGARLVDYRTFGLFSELDARGGAVTCQP